MVTYDLFEIEDLYDIDEEHVAVEFYEGDSIVGSIPEEYPRTVEYGSIGSSEIVNIGVRHEDEFYEEWGDVLYEEIRESEGVVVESTGLELYEEYSFFGEVIRDAFDAGKPVYRADPNNAALHVIDEALFWGMGLYTLAGIGANLVGVATGDPDMLKLGMGLSTVSPYLCRGTTKGFVLAKGWKVVRDALDNDVSSDELKEFMEEHDALRFAESYTLMDRLSWGSIDYRNLMIAEGMESVALADDPDRLVGIHGSAHTRGISHYLENRGVRSFKRKLYAWQRSFTEAGVRKYLPSEENRAAIEEGLTKGGDEE